MRQQHQGTGTDPYDKVREAALGRDQSDTSKSWALADAVLAMIPPEQAGRPPAPGESPAPRQVISDRLATLADRLYDDGNVQPNWGTYTANTLKEMRETAMAWPKSDRHTEAAFRTHQEAGAKNGNGRQILTALCSVARGEKVARPLLVDNKGSEICTAEVWTEVRRAITKRKGTTYPVSANDVRLLLNRKPNVPTPNPTPTTTSAASSSGTSTATTTSTASTPSTPNTQTPEQGQQAASDGAPTHNAGDAQRAATGGSVHDDPERAEGHHRRLERCPGPRRRGLGGVAQRSRGDRGRPERHRHPHGREALRRGLSKPPA